MSEPFGPHSGQSCYRHPVWYCKSLIGLAVLILAGAAGLQRWPPLAVCLWVAAAIWIVWIYLDWQWRLVLVAVDERLALSSELPDSEQSAIGPDNYHFLVELRPDAE